jgi:hypothetical protein
LFKYLPIEKKLWESEDGKIPSENNSFVEIAILL